MLVVPETKFRKLNAPGLIPDVWDGAKCRHGVRVDDHQERDAARLVYTPIDRPYPIGHSMEHRLPGPCLAPDVDNDERLEVELSPQDLRPIDPLG